MKRKLKNPKKSNLDTPEGKKAVREMQKLLLGLRLSELFAPIPKVYKKG